MIVNALFLWDCIVYSKAAIVELSHDVAGTVFTTSETKCADVARQLAELGVLRSEAH